MARRMHLTHEAVLAAIIVLVATGLSFATGSFLSIENLVDILVAASFTGILAAGLVVVLVSGGIDISFTATATVAQYLAGYAILNAGAGWMEAFAISAAVGFLLGAVNATLIHLLKVSPIIVTIATLNLFYGVMMGLTSGTWLYGFPMWFVEGITAYSFDLPGDRAIAITLPLMAMLAIWGIAYVLLEKLPIGRAIYAMGSNQEAARRMGFGLYRLHLVAYGFMGFAAGVAGLTQAQLTQTVAPNAFVGGELAVLAAVVLGGASLTGGAGTIGGTILGVLLIAILENGLTLMAVSSYAHPIFLGLIIVASVSINAMRQKRRVVRT